MDGRRVLLYSCGLLVRAARVGQGSGAGWRRSARRWVCNGPHEVRPEGVEVVVEAAQQGDERREVRGVPGCERRDDRLLPPVADLAGERGARVGGRELYGAPVLRVGPAFHVTGAGELPDVTADRGGVEHGHLREL